MQEGFVRFMKRYFYWVFAALALLSALFGVFVPPVAVVFILLLGVLAIFFAYYHFKTEVVKEERRVRVAPSRPTMRVEDVDGALSRMPDMDEMAAEAARGAPRVKAHIIEGSGMELVERYVPIGELLFPIAFIANKEAERYQEGSLEVSAPLCLWHGQAVWFTPTEGKGGVRFMHHCPKCPEGGKPTTRSLKETTKAVELIAASTLRSGKMPMRDETIIEAIKRGSGELPG